MSIAHRDNNARTAPMSRRDTSWGIIPYLLAIESKTNPNSPTCAKFKPTPKAVWGGKPNSSTTDEINNVFAAMMSATPDASTNICSARKAGGIVNPVEETNSAKNKLEVGSTA